MQVFISYAQSDAKTASRIASALRESGLEVWDDSQLFPGDNWAAKVAKALSDSEAMVVLLSPSFLASPHYVASELGYALGSEQYKGRVFPVVVAPFDLASLGNEVPWVLKRLQTIRLDDPDKDEEGLRQIASAIKKAA
jgi:hypothetical protein